MLSLRPGFQVGLGYRRPLHAELMAAEDGAVDFVELAPENYLGLGGSWRRRLDAVCATWPVITHGLALSLGGPDPLDSALLAGLASFCEAVGTPWHSDHLCFGSAGGHHSHELLPVPRTRENARRVATRVQAAAARLPVPLAIENVSVYGTWPQDELDESDFVSEVVERAGCGLLLDVNNVLVNGINFGLDPFDILARMPLAATVQIHVAGFERREEDLVIDTHGEEVDDQVWPLLEAALRLTGPVPVLLERDNHIPPLEDLLAEIATIRAIGARVFGPGEASDG